MTDPTGHDATARALAYLHPAWMLASLGLAALALRSGLRIRRGRQRGERPALENRARHLRLAKPALLCLAAGFVGGLGSAVALRGWAPLSSFHGLVATAALALFVAVGWLGRRLEQGRAGAREAHAIAALLAVLLAALAALAGFVLLP
ncbi:MAG: DUF4079 family protein [Proteobacteria bacterium]|nr:DUF4079 family protein [Pseudomonadota bacterium]